jgi:hypothetical protein
VDLVLTDPHGKVVDGTYQDATITEDTGLALITIKKPVSGKWALSVFGQDVPSTGEPYYAAVSTRQSFSTTGPMAPGFPVVILILVLMGGGIAVYTLAQTRTKGRSRTAVGILSAQLVCISGELAGQTVLLRDRMIVGRGSGSTLKLKDRTVSRQHAVFRFAGGQWFIQDLNSQTGTFVNDARIQATSLKNGDRIRIGSSVFEFHIAG